MTQCRLVARIAGIDFRLAGAATATLPALETTLVLLLDRDAVHAAWEDGICYLLIDHRRTPRDPGPAHVEAWVPLSVGEAPVVALLVVVEGHLSLPQPPAPTTLASFVRTIIAAADQLPAPPVLFDADPQLLQ